MSLEPLREDNVFSSKIQFVLIQHISVMFTHCYLYRVVAVVFQKGPVDFLHHQMYTAKQQTHHIETNEIWPSLLCVLKDELGHNEHPSKLFNL